MKKNKVLRIACILMVLALVSTCGMVGTLAKYTTSGTGDSDVARAGLFRVTIGSDFGTSVALSSAGFTVPVTATLYEEDGTTEEDHAAAGNADNIIVPGTVLEVPGINIYNPSEVDVKITAALNTSAAAYTMPLEFSLSATGDWGTLADLNTALAGASATTLAALDTTGAEAVPTIYVRWVFGDSANNALDTGIGEYVAGKLLSATHSFTGEFDDAAPQTLNFAWTVTADQVN